MPMRQERAMSALLWTSFVLVLLVTLATWLSGGFRLAPFGWRVSSSSVLRPYAAAVLVGLLLWRRPRDRERLSALRTRALLPAAVMCCAAFAWSHAAPYAAAADMYGYVSQAIDWTNGRLAHPEWIDTTYFPASASVPLGYLYAADQAPTALALYPPGMSLHMALARVVFGDWAMYLVSPLAALALVAGTYALGRAYVRDSSGRVAALLMAINPVLLAQAAVPMSDTLAAAYWTWSLTLAASRKAGAQVGAGALAGLAIVVRPNLVPLLFGPAAAALLSSGIGGGVRLTLACAPLVAFLGWHQARLYGAMLATGYGSTAQLFSPAYVAENARRYTAWVWRTSSPLPLAGFVVETVVTLVRRHFTIQPLVVVVFLDECFYLPYQPWPAMTFARFPLPALPIVMLLAVAAGHRVSARSPVAFGALVVVVLGWQLAFAQASELRIGHEALSRFKELGTAITARHLEDRPIITRSHSGSLRHYAAAHTYRWDQMSTDEMRDGIARARAAGLLPLIVDDSDDRADFERQHGAIACWVDSPTPVLTIQRHATTSVFVARFVC
jgi:hypothetical protein